MGSGLSLLRHEPVPGPTVSPHDFKLRSIDLYLTSSCNRRCSYCFLTDGYLSSGTRMSLDDIRSILQWAGQGGSIDEITLLGGEPALHPEFASIMELIGAKGLRNRTVTNGSKAFQRYLSSPERAQRVHRVAVSLDAPTEGEFDRMRGRGAFRDVMNTIAALRRHAIPFDINYTVMRSNVDSVLTMVSFAEALGADRLNVHWFSLVGRARTHASDQSLSALEWRWRVLEPIRAYQSPRPNYVVDCEMAFSFELPGEEANACAVQDLDNLQFFPSGAVFSCGMLVEDESRSGYTFRDGQLIRRSGPSEWTETANACHGCPLRPRDGEYVPVCIYNRLRT